MISLRASADKGCELRFVVEVGSLETVGVADCSVAPFGVQAANSQQHKRSFACFCIFLLTFSWSRPSQRFLAEWKAQITGTFGTFATNYVSRIYGCSYLHLPHGLVFASGFRKKPYICHVPSGSWSSVLSNLITPPS